MLNFLKSLFKTPEGDFPSLMDSRDPKIELSITAISTIVEALKPITLPAYSLILCDDLKSELPQLPVDTLWPINKKKKPLLYFGTVETDDFKIAIFQHEDGMKNDDSNLKIFYIDKKNSPELTTLQPDDEKLISTQQYKKTATITLPIWEEIIHRYPDIHKLIVKLAPNHPWTLYKTAKQKICGDSIVEQLGGYPQWCINDIDYRKLKNSMFIIQIKEIGDKKVVFLFNTNGELSFFKQNSF